jgi:hypothetical protein
MLALVVEPVTLTLPCWKFVQEQSTGGEVISESLVNRNKESERQRASYRFPLANDVRVPFLESVRHAYTQDLKGVTRSFVNRNRSFSSQQSSRHDH